jgi:NTE family protein
VSSICRLPTEHAIPPPNGYLPCFPSGGILVTDGTPPARPASYDKKVGLVLQGGGALGSYQAGVYEALASSQYLPDWVAGISIGAINAAIIAGNAPEHRVQRLRSFWEEITAPTKL